MFGMGPICRKKKWLDRKTFCSINVFFIRAETKFHPCSNPLAKYFEHKWNSGSAKESRLKKKRIYPCRTFIGTRTIFIQTLPKKNYCRVSELSEWAFRKIDSPRVLLKLQIRIIENLVISTNITKRCLTMQ